MQHTFSGKFWETLRYGIVSRAFAQLWPARKSVLEAIATRLKSTLQCTYLTCSCAKCHTNSPSAVLHLLAIASVRWCSCLENKKKKYRWALWEGAVFRFTSSARITGIQRFGFQDVFGSGVAFGQNSGTVVAPWKSPVGSERVLGFCCCCRCWPRSHTSAAFPCCSLAFPGQGFRLWFWFPSGLSHLFFIQKVLSSRKSSIF